MDDIEEIPEGYELSSIGLLKEKPIVSPNPSTPSVVVTSDDVERIQSLSRDELVDLCRRMACQCGLVTLMSEEEIDQAHYDVLAAKGIKGDITAIRERWDRKRGKAAQTINQNVSGAVLMASREEVADIVRNWLENPATRLIEAPNGK